MIPAVRESTSSMGDPEDDDEDEEQKKPRRSGVSKAYSMQGIRGL